MCIAIMYISKECRTIAPLQITPNELPSKLFTFMTCFTTWNDNGQTLVQQSWGATGPGAKKLECKHSMGQISCTHVKGFENQIPTV